ncbi:hypothetical protein M758_4G086200 [Ceratodon purpureus]|nr:hypothetical protein M758_4G086200 [Ceratodon purpureus]
MAGDAWKPHAALVLVQLNYGGYHVITKLALSVGINQLVFCVLRDVIALLILGPLAYFTEKRQRPPMSAYYLFSFFFLGLTGIFANQLLFTLGLNLTSPFFAAAMQPAIPVFTFVLAVLLRTETVHWGRIDGKAKVAGVIVCVTGAIFMAFYKGPALLGDGFSDLHLQGVAIAGKPAPEPVGWLAGVLIDLGIDLWHIGVLCLIGNCLCLALYIVYQAPLLASYPASLSVTAYSYAFGACFMSMTGFFFANDSADWSLTWGETFAVFYAGIVASAVNYGLLTYSNKMVGPSLVALYIPLQPVASSFLSRIFLGSSLYLGSVVGGALIVAGLYIVIWGRQESEKYLSIPHRRLPITHATRDASLTISDPLLKVLNHRGPSTPAGPTLPMSRSWQFADE